MRKVKHARVETDCSICNTTIKIGDTYFSSAYTSYCVKCEAAKREKRIRYSNKNKSYIQDSRNKVCEFCNKEAKHVIDGIATCKDCVGRALPDEI